MICLAEICIWSNLWRECQSISGYKNYWIIEFWCLLLQRTEYGKYANIQLIA